jgi:P4 family phage/plasmid primase-like protien
MSVATETLTAQQRLALATDFYDANGRDTSKLEQHLKDTYKDVDWSLVLANCVERVKRLSAERSWAGLEFSNKQLDDMVTHLESMFEPGDFLDLYFIHATDKWIDDNGGEHSVTRDYFVTLEDAIKPETLQHIQNMQRQGFHSYIFMNTLTGEPDPIDGKLHRRMRDVKAVRTVFVEIDDNGVDGLKAIFAAVKAGLLPNPHVVLESSPGKYQVIWYVRGFDVPRQRAVNKAVQVLANGDGQAIDAARVLRTPGTYNLKPAYNLPVVGFRTMTIDGIEYGASDEDNYTPEDFKLEHSVQRFDAQIESDDAEFEQRCELVAKNFELAGVQVDAVNRIDEYGYAQFNFDCPWKDQHTTPGDTAALFLRKTGYGFKCFHSHCAERHWKPDVKNWLQEQAGNVAGNLVALNWGEVPFEATIEGKVAQKSEEPGANWAGGWNWTSAHAFGADIKHETVIESVISGLELPQDVDIDKNEVGNALRVIARDGQNFRYVKEEGCFIIFDRKEGIWKYDRDGQGMRRFMVDMVTAMKREAKAILKAIEGEVAPIITLVNLKTLEPKNDSVAQLTADQLNLIKRWKEAARYVQWAQISETKQKTDAAVDLVYCQPVDVNISVNELNNNRYICKAMNGTFVFNTANGEITFRNHLRSDLCTFRMPVTYDPEATCDEFLEFIDDMTLGDKSMQDMLQEFLGLCLTGIVIREMMLLIGDGSDGKGALGRLISAVLGDGADGYALPCSMRTFLQSRDDGHGDTPRSDEKQMRGKRLLLASEASRKNVLLNIDLIKRLTGSDMMNTRGQHDRDRTLFPPMAKIILAANREPQVDDPTKSARDRIKIVKCLMSLTKDQIDIDLEKRIIEDELPGILNWLLAGLQRALKRGKPLMVFTEQVEHDSMLFHDTQNPMKAFVESTVHTADEFSTLQTDELYQRYQSCMAAQNLFSEQKSTLVNYVIRKTGARLCPGNDSMLLGVTMQAQEVRFS